MFFLSFSQYKVKKKSIILTVFIRWTQDRVSGFCQHVIFPSNSTTIWSNAFNKCVPFYIVSCVLAQIGRASVCVHWIVCVADSWIYYPLSLIVAFQRSSHSASLTNNHRCSRWNSQVEVHIWLMKGIIYKSNKSLTNTHPLFNPELSVNYNLFSKRDPATVSDLLKAKC